MTNEISKQMMYEWYDRFNNEFFNNTLPPSKEVIMGFNCFKNKNTMGQCTERIFGNIHEHSIILNLSILDLPITIETIQGIFIHEMIHLYCNINNVKCGHRGLFKQYKDKIEKISNYSI